ncbi:hypothetical protein PoB_007074200 [Plakobranchus ocellatus]|uniref:Uncharacterized protein n=1 Tax=Plakobranchus ocellatus TaxID=259542 RepID=A0AAV4DJ01_9GAST|nr:hypothetical protein PoB_007074200 [Plakobranchus ocellatus]
MQVVCKRKYKTLSLLAVVAGLFYMLQCLSVFRLGELSHARARAWGDSNHNSFSSHLDDEDQHMLLKGRNRVVDGESRMIHGIDEADLHKERDDGRSKNKDLKYIGNVDKDDGFQAKKGKDQLRPGKDDGHSNSRKLVQPMEINVRGVLPKDRHLYTAGDDGLFACLSQTQVNSPRKMLK